MFCFDGWIGYQKRRERKVMRAGMFRWPRNYAVEAFISREGEEEEEEINQNLGQLNKHNINKNNPVLPILLVYSFPFYLRKIRIQKRTLSYLSSYVFDNVLLFRLPLIS